MGKQNEKRRCLQLGLCWAHTFRLLNATLNLVWHFGHSKRPISICILLPVLSGGAVIVHLFFGEPTSAPHLMHLAMCSAHHRSLGFGLGG